MHELKAQQAQGRQIYRITHPVTKIHLDIIITVTRNKHTVLLSMWHLKEDYNRSEIQTTLLSIL